MTLFTDEQVDKIVEAIRRLSYGSQSGPTGMESVAMAIGGEGAPGADGGLKAGLESISTSIRDGSSEIADALVQVADALRGVGSAATDISQAVEHVSQNIQQ
jgi:hypothetical protein